jgi:hypothetical protein
LDHLLRAREKEEEEGVVAVCLRETVEEKVTLLVGRCLVEFVVLDCLYFPKAVKEERAGGICECD